MYAYRVAQLLMTFSDLRDHLPIANLFKYDAIFWCSLAQQLIGFQPCGRLRSVSVSLAADVKDSLSYVVSSETQRAMSLNSFPEILNLTLILHGPTNPKLTLLSRPERVLGLAWPGPVLGRQIWPRLLLGLNEYIRSAAGQRNI